jgi:dsRNA-specific ribonuclease
LSPGGWDGLHKQVLSNANLARVGFGLGIQIYIKVYARTVVSNKMTETAIEAIAGAAYLDGGEHALDVVMRTMSLFDETTKYLDDDSVTFNSHSLPPLLA